MLPDNPQQLSQFQQQQQQIFHQQSCSDQNDNEETEIMRIFELFRKFELKRRHLRETSSLEAFAQAVLADDSYLPVWCTAVTSWNSHVMQMCLIALAVWVALC